MAMPHLVSGTSGNREMRAYRGLSDRMACTYGSITPINLSGLDEGSFRGISAVTEY